MAFLSATATAILISLNYLLTSVLASPLNVLPSPTCTLNIHHPFSLLPFFPLHSGQHTKTIHIHVYAHTVTSAGLVDCKSCFLSLIPSIPSPHFKYGENRGNGGQGMKSITATATATATITRTILGTATETLYACLPSPISSSSSSNSAFLSTGSESEGTSAERENKFEMKNLRKRPNCCWKREQIKSIRSRMERITGSHFSMAGLQVRMGLSGVVILVVSFSLPRRGRWE